ncbi:MAG: iron-containing alcohol dehydrogenase, partial [Verrucomicrobia subdivision 3 bacterium]|nr:iron-containing alcohol dehydrogenase [Limisphaerales bacterium]
IAHAVETAVTTKRTALSQRLSAAAFTLCNGALPEVLQNPNDLAARGRMQLGAAYAGAAIENSMLGAAHAAANPLTAHFGIVHGQAVGLMLPHVVRFNGGEAEAQAAYAALARAAGLVSCSESDARAVLALGERLETLLALARLPRTLAECGVAESALVTLADEAARQWTAGFNPRRVTRDDFAELYAAAWG